MGNLFEQEQSCEWIAGPGDPLTGLLLLFSEIARAIPSEAYLLIAQPRAVA